MKPHALVIGTGRVGCAVANAIAGSRAWTVKTASMRVLEDAGSVPRRFEADAIVYAAGPAGETASRENPARAFRQHYSHVIKFVQAASPNQRIAVIGTVLPNAGFYGALKHLALDHARFAATSPGYSGMALWVLCGQVLGGPGVVRRWLDLSRSGQPLILNCHGHVTVPPLQCKVGPPLLLTRGEDIGTAVVDWLLRPALAWEETRVTFPDPVPLVALARACALVGDKSAPIVLGCRPGMAFSQLDPKPVSDQLMTALRAVA